MSGTGPKAGGPHYLNAFRSHLFYRIPLRRFVHTGEYYGLTGQTIAGLVSAGGAVLVYTGVALALRRFGAWRRRRTTTRLRAVAA